jgi:tRNA threonylcarbamoyladenosine biosynthesis protein TsaE
MAASLGRTCVIALEGELGSGKTCLAKGIAKGLGITETVTSPTYTIISEYEREDGPALFHIDAYRLNGDEDFTALGGEELINGEGIFLIEWACRIRRSLPPDTISVSIKITGASSRLIQIKGLELK